LDKYDYELELEPYIVFDKQTAVQLEREKMEKIKNGPYTNYIENSKKFAKNATAEHIKYLKSFMSEYNRSDEKIFEDLREYYGDMIDENDNVLSTDNPNAMWDSWALGGQWSDCIVTDNGRCDFAKIKDVNFSMMKEVDGRPFCVDAIIPFEGEWEDYASTSNKGDNMQPNTDERWSDYIQQKLKEANPEHYLVIVDSYF
jgi:hypothetical protein